MVQLQIQNFFPVSLVWRY